MVLVSSMSTTTSALPSTPSAPSAVLASLVFGASKPHESTTTILPSAARSTERRAQRELDHLLRGLLVVLARLRAEGHATTAEVRRPDRALTGVAGALLLERLLATATHLGAGLGALRAARRAASWAVTTWCITGTLGWTPNTVVVELERAGVLAGASS